MFISDRDGIINLHQVSTSQQEADIDDNRPMACSSDVCKSKNRCQKPRFLTVIFWLADWNKSRNQEELFLMILAVYRLQRILTRPVPSWANLPVIVKRMSCHEYKIQVCTLKWHTQTGIKKYRPTSSHVRRPHSNLWTVVHLCLCPDFLMYGTVTHKFLLTLHRHTRMISYSFSYSYSGKQKRRKTRKWQIIRTDPHHQVVIPEPFPEPFTLVSYTSGKKKADDRKDDAHYFAQRNPPPINLLWINKKNVHRMARRIRRCCWRIRRFCWK